MSTGVSNVVAGKELRGIQVWTMKLLSAVVEKTFGPTQSNTWMILDGAYSEYSKDGHTVLGEVKLGARIEEAIRQEISLLTLEIANTVGDGTTSAVILSSIIMTVFAKLEEEGLMDVRPFEFIERFKACVEEIKQEILKRKQEFTPELAYEIAHIATNGNAWVAGQIKDLYSKYGNELHIEILTSPNKETYTREYDGLTLPAGYADICYQNTTGKALAVIHNAEIYSFSDPIDTPAMGDVFKEIIEKNIYEPGKAGKEMTPTVILCPKIGYDYDFLMGNLAKMMYAYPDATMKPPILIITNIPGNSLYDSITSLSGAKWIKKFIDPKVKEQEAKAGNVCTVTNFKSFAGSADLVRSDAEKSVFINPKNMYEGTDGEGNPKLSTMYNTYLQSLKNELEEAERATMDLNIIGNIRRKIHCLQSNMVDFAIGGITVGERDSLRHLVEDAVKSCASAAQYGVGYAANCEGLLATHKLIGSDELISPILADAYKQLVMKLYTKTLSTEEAEDAFSETFVKEMPIDLRSKEFNGKVLGSIMSDVVILETISKILSLMITCNQVILPNPAHMINYTPIDADIE